MEEGLAPSSSGCKARQEGFEGLSRLGLGGAVHLPPQNSWLGLAQGTGRLLHGTPLRDVAGPSTWLALASVARACGRHCSPSSPPLLAMRWPRWVEGLWGWDCPFITSHGTEPWAAGPRGLIRKGVPGEGAGSPAWAPVPPVLWRPSSSPPRILGS